MTQRIVLLFIMTFILTILTITAQDDPPTTSVSQPRTLTVWLPAPLISDTNSEAFQLLETYTEQFADDNDITVEYRIKAIGQPGGIMSTIRAGSVVAPGALPDVTLIRRIDLTTAQAPQFLQSLENLFSSALLNDIDNALILGQVGRSENLELFGLPYFMELLHTVYTQPSEDVTTALSFEDILTVADSFNFPAGRTSELNQTVYIQYLAAGGTPPRNNEMTLNPDALQSVLTFYESAVERGIITSDVLNYNTPSAYRTEFINSMDGLNFGVFSSSEYLSMLGQEPGLSHATLPTAEGNTATILNGWMWVLVTPDPNQQDLSIRYLNWMMEPEFHAELSQQIFQLPAQNSAIVASLPPRIDPPFIDDLLNNAVLPLTENEGGAVRRAIQEALVRVLNEEITAEEATQQVVDQFGVN